MFEEIFTRQANIKRCQSAPLIKERVVYLNHLADLGSNQNTLRRMAVAQVHLVRLLDLEIGGKVTLPQVEAAAKEWSRPNRNRYMRRRRELAPSTATRRFLGRAIGWLRFLGQLEETVALRHPHTAEVSDYEVWMREERGLSESTIRGYCAAADHFLEWLSVNGLPLGSVSVSDIDRAIETKKATGLCNRTTMNIYSDRLRAFFRFAEHRGWCSAGIAAAMKPNWVYPDETIPTGLARGDVLRLLATTEGNRSADKRDRAVLMLFIAYGLRVGEVRRLALEDLDWENETIRVRRSKSGKTDIYPLSQGVGKAVLRYIVEVRPPRPERALFLTLNAPIRPIGRCGIGSIVSNRLKRIGITKGRRGPHTLRHAAAQHLLDEGIPMKVIGDFLGHRSLSSTAIYAKVNINALREVAQFDLGGLA